MVVAEKWAEQRVLMRAYTSGRDQTQPTITLHGHELAIGPASLDPNGPWGIHVAPLVEGRAQELQHMLEAAAKRLAGSKGNPPRLLDEEGTFDREPTGNWELGSPRIVPGASRSREMEPMQVARIAASASTYHAQPAHAVPITAPSAMPVSAMRQPAAASSSTIRSTPMPMPQQYRCASKRPHRAWFSIWRRRTVGVGAFGFIACGVVAVGSLVAQRGAN
jgi:hypothetical protein